MNQFSRLMLLWLSIAYVTSAPLKAGQMQQVNPGVARETAEVLSGPSGFHWRKCTRAELHVYNIRHIQHHAAQLILRLRNDAGVDVPWVSHAWKEA
jgi:hypothetical protein